MNKKEVVTTANKNTFASASRAEEKEFEDFGWLGKYLKIKEIDDVEFRKLIFASITTQNKKRRFERHNTDLIYCLRTSFAHKIRPREFSEDAHSMVWHWMRGKGIEIGIVDALISLLAEGGAKGLFSKNPLIASNPEAPPVLSQKETSIGRSRGHVDLELFGLQYEITTRLFWGSLKHPRKFPPIDKIFQELSYLASEKKPTGRIKLYIMVPPAEMIEVDSPRGLKSVKIHKKIKRAERTWELTLTKAGLKFFINTFKNRDNQLSRALETGNWRILPKAYFPWRCRRCDICEWFEQCPNEVAILWLKWRHDKKEWEKAVEKSSTAPPARRSLAQEPDSGSITQERKPLSEGHNRPSNININNQGKLDDPLGHNPHSPSSRSSTTHTRDSLIKNTLKKESTSMKTLANDSGGSPDLISELRIWVDGCGPGQDHPSRYAFFCQICDKSQVFENRGLTCNEAEFMAVIEAFKHLKKVKHKIQPPDVIQIISDSKLVINQLAHKWHVKEDRLRNLALRAWDIAPKPVEYVWVKRKDNLAGKLLG